MRATVIAMVFFCAAQARAEDEIASDEARHQQGLKLMELDRYNEALVELEAAYAIRQRPEFLYDMGRAHQKLGHAKEAREFFERYLVADQTMGVSRRSEVEGRLHVLVRALPPPPAIAQPQMTIPAGYVRVRTEMRPRTGLLAGGITLLSLGYTPALITGAIWIGLDIEPTAGGVLLIPIIGPIISGILEPSPWWSVPWIVVDHVAQAAGLAMIIAGALSKQKVQVIDAPVSVLPTSLPGGAGLVAFGRF